MSGAIPNEKQTLSKQMTIMKRNRILPIFASALIAMTGSCSGFDDSALWNDVDNIYTSLTELSSQLEQTNAQLRLLGAVVRGGAITSITVDSDGSTRHKLCRRGQCRAYRDGGR